LLGSLRLRPAIKRARGVCALLKRDEGNLVEYAIVVILFLTLMFGIAGFGHMFYAYQYVNHAAKSAARWAAVNGATCNSDAAYSTNGKGSCTTPATSGCASGSPSPWGGFCLASSTTPVASGDISNYVEMITPSNINWNKVNVTSTWNPAGASGPPGCGGSSTTKPPPGNEMGCIVQVQVQYTYNFIFPLISTSPMTLTSTAETVISH